MITEPNLKLLESILTLRRNHGSPGERTVGRLLVKSFGFQEHQDDRGMALSFIRKVGADSSILWSSHIDTVHATDGLAKITFDATDTMLVASDGNSPLGADNGAGMWLLLEMIANQVPGTYIFHRGEEKGGIGSRAMARYWPELIRKHTHAIAFDRRGSDDVITHQFVGRCCSDRFATQLCFLLNGSATDPQCKERGFEYAKCDGGSFTDTASYIELVPECTNVSVGYMDEHTSRETLDLEHLLKLRERVVQVFKSPPNLIVHRKVTDKETRWEHRGQRWGEWGDCGYGGYGGSRYRGRTNYGERAQDDGFGVSSYTGGLSKKQQKRKDKKEKRQKELTLVGSSTAGDIAFGGVDKSQLAVHSLTADQVLDMPHSRLVYLVREDPGGAADLISDLASALVVYQTMEAEAAANDGKNDERSDDEHDFRVGPDYVG